MPRRSRPPSPLSTSLDKPVDFEPASNLDANLSEEALQSLQFREAAIGPSRTRLLARLLRFCNRSEF